MKFALCLPCSLQVLVYEETNEQVRAPSISLYIPQIAY